MHLKASDNTGRYNQVRFGNIHAPRPLTDSATAPLSYKEGFSPRVKIAESQATVSTASDTVEADIHTFTLPANLLNRDGAKVELESIGTFGATGNNKTLKLYWGGTQVFSSGAVAANATTWHLRMKVVRDATQTQRIYVDGHVNNTNVTSVYTTGAKDETTALIAKLTGTNGTAAATEINGTLAEVFYTM